MIHALRAATLLGLSSLLAACSLLPKAQPIDIYLLPPSTLASQASSPRLAQTLSVVRPQASQVLDSTRIAVVPAGSRISSYKGARWGDPAPSLLRDRLLDVLRRDGRFTAVASDEQHLHSDLELRGNLLSFQSEYHDGQVQAVIRLDAQLVDSESRHILASRRFEVSQTSSDAQVASVVDAFGTASDSLARQLSDWLLASAPKARQTAP
ncbi:ABC-type transport auxiliary lipoprotein family protein [Aquipseudomonas ullengensis]|uniref:Membrane integrity-associated transporter subunit PqiC n=1 Tax=Aquipseudomonas ullengensis TaxID=2759166 RepID=A0A7W4LNC9_9GAMM|nr:LPS assembly lipoprotein LptE [Pseudomonas ullengensis]MBB2496250.1 membrane integrity-associated transporter subunit PqiC [Pseudomonas ullengensis]